MTYYDENGYVIPESQVDPAHGYVEPKDYLHHPAIPAVTHEVVTPLIDGSAITSTVVDVPGVPAWDEIISMIYHYTGATEAERIDALEYAQSVTEDAVAELGEIVGGLTDG